MKSKAKIIEPGEKVGMKLSAAQRTLIAAEVPSLDGKFKRAIRDTPAKEPLLLNLQEWDELSESISQAANHSKVEKIEEQLTNIVVKIDQVLDAHIDTSADKMLADASATVAKIDPQQIAVFVEWADMWDAAAKESGIEDDRIIPLTLESAPLEILQTGLLSGIAQAKKLLNGRTLCTATEVSSIIRSLITALKARPPLEQMAILILIDQIMGQLETAVTDMAGGTPRRAAAAKKTAKAKVASSAKPVFQIKVTLKHVEPPIWRRILTKDCSLDMLHRLIQASMGWSNSHLHHFRVGKEYYSNQAMMDDPWGGADADENDSTKANLSDVVPDSGKKFRFEYEYDFGDGWVHEILIEKSLAEDKGMKYPLCTDGAGACPIEDIGGPFGYMDFLAAMADPKHERREDFAEMIEGMKRFDPLAFDIEKATKAMQRGKRA